LGVLVVTPLITGLLNILIRLDLIKYFTPPALKGEALTLVNVVPLGESELAARY